MPCRLFILTSSSVSIEQLSIDVGSVPVRLLISTRKFSKFHILPMLAGIFPVKAFLSAFINSKELRFAMTSKRGPVK